MTSRLTLAALLSVLARMLCGLAQASSDYQCDPGWSLDFAALPECANIADLLPGNDTRANLALLLADRNRSPTSTTLTKRPLLAWHDFRAFFSNQAPNDAGPYASGEGSRCRSDAAGAKAFSAAVEAAANLSPEERVSLISACGTLMPQCEGVNAPPAAETPAAVTSTEGHAFATYLHAASAFYAGQFDEASTSFEALRSDSDSWLADTAAYMVARTAVNRLQDGAFEPYGTLRGITPDEKAAGAAASLDAYLREHPNGRYATSARGLQRRVAWLGGSTADLAARYAAAIAQSEGARGLDNATLAEEIDNKLLPTFTPEMTRDPVLLAVLDLKAMRRGTPDTPQAPRPDLAAQRDAFASVPELYAFLEAAAAFYLDGRPRAVIESIPDDTRRRGGDHLWFSRQLLRGLALEAVGDRNALGFWKDLLSGATRPLDGATAQLALALDDERRRDPDDAFAAGSPLNDPGIRAILLTQDAGPTLLRSRARDTEAAPRERQIALFALLTKELTRGLYGDFLLDIARVSADAPTKGSVVIDPVGDADVPLGLFVRGETAGDIGCPSLITTVTRLASNPGGVHDQLCLAEWLRLNGFDPDHFADPPRKGGLGLGPSAFPGRSSTRLDLYRAVIAARAAPADGRAYALYRAVKCYEPSGYNACGGIDAPKTERHRWYDALKRDYPGSRWARALPYWW